jgi:DNA-binding response OmpR family regulator
VMCIDNEHTILDGMHGLLSKWGARPLIATNEESALKQLQELEGYGDALPSILIVDYHLDDDVTGVEVIRRLRERADNYIPAIVVTADHTDSVRQEVRESGDALLHKPIKPAALRAQMSRLLSHR